MSCEAVAGIVLGLCLALLLHGCAEPTAAPKLVTSVQAAELDSAPPIARKYRAALTREARAAWGYPDAPVPMLAAQIAQESGWNEAARSPVGAGGLAQFMPSTASDYPDEQGKVDIYSPEWALRAQSRYMHDLYGRLKYSRDCDRMGAALSSYNGGIGHANDRQKLAADSQDFWNSVRVIQPPKVSAASQAENADYPHRIVVKLQPTYRFWGTVTCPEMLT